MTRMYAPTHPPATKIAVKKKKKKKKKQISR
jgi:hypothetical protein